MSDLWAKIEMTPTGRGSTGRSHDLITDTEIFQNIIDRLIKIHIVEKERRIIAGDCASMRG